ncbi:hypothetical protein ABZ512_00880 [Nocardiopsis dassonvillei]|uniref:hypothetical protein n=1 Tax=Nocardiopsis dassonvillei TaxID=2014 RepID=UPI00157C59F4|nr:hypothetical protein [Nocardiopsis dassonvillei]
MNTTVPMALGFSIEPVVWNGIATMVAAILAATIAIIGYNRQQKISRQERRAAIYSEALRAVEDYLEAPYLILRRDGSAGARREITTRISDIQSRMSYYSALLEIHAHAEIGMAYQALSASARSEAGKAMREAWRTRPTLKDKEVPIHSRIDRSRSDEARRIYIQAIKSRDF